MAQGYKDFTAGAVLTAADLEDYNQNQSTMRFANAAARDSALTTVKTEGMRAYLIDVNTETIYNGTAWSTIGPVHGALTAWTPVITQGATPTLTNTLSWYTRVGRHITGGFNLTPTSGGTAANLIVVSLPVTAATGTDIVGTGYCYDTSAALFYGSFLLLETGTQVRFHCISVDASFTAGRLGSNTFTAGLANGDAVSGTFSYQAAADA